MSRWRAVLGGAAREGLASLAGRPGKAILLSLGAMLGTASVTAILTLATSASLQVDEQFNELRSTRITLTNADDPEWLDDGWLGRASGISGVRQIGVAREASDRLGATAQPDGLVTPVPVKVLAAGTEYLNAAGAILINGRMYDDGAIQRSDDIVLLGVGLARSLGDPPADGQTTIQVNGHRLLVVGIIDAGPQGDPNVTLQAFVPATRTLPGAKWLPPTVTIDTERGSTDTIASVAAVALSPTDAGHVFVQLPADPQGLRSQVSTELQTLLMLLGAVSLGIGIVVISTAALSSVAERRVEIALRRALGTSRTEIYLQIVVETAIIGTLGGLAGAYLGQLSTVAFAATAGWPIATNLMLLPASAAVGAVAGAIAGLYPAARAAIAHPADALRG